MANTVTRFTSGGEVTETYNVGSGPVSIAILDNRTTIDEIAEIPEIIGLKSPYPNPFNSSVIIPFEGKSGNTAIIEIFDINGRLVKRLSSMPEYTINNNVVWNGSDMIGNEVVSGIYFAHLAGTSESVKLVFLR
jgi:hypothetical protein